MFLPMTLCQLKPAAWSLTLPWYQSSAEFTLACALGSPAATVSLQMCLAHQSEEKVE